MNNEKKFEIEINELPSQLSCLVETIENIENTNEVVVARHAIDHIHDYGASIELLPPIIEFKIKYSQVFLESFSKELGISTDGAIFQYVKKLMGPFRYSGIEKAKVILPIDQDLQCEITYGSHEAMEISLFIDDAAFYTKLKYFSSAFNNNYLDLEILNDSPVASCLLTSRTLIHNKVYEETAYFKLPMLPQSAG